MGTGGSGTTGGRSDGDDTVAGPARAEGTTPVGVSVELSASPVPAGTAVRATAVVDPTAPNANEVTGAVRFTVDGTSVGHTVALVGGQASAAVVVGRVAVQHRP